jgi:hypothetical protein
VKFKVGDRVAYYLSSHRRTGKVLSVHANASLQVDEDNASPRWEYNVHPKQCRKLVKKPRRKVFILEQELVNFQKETSAPAWEKPWEDLDFDSPWVEFVEVKKK